MQPDDGLPALIDFDSLRGSMGQYENLLLRLLALFLEQAPVWSREIDEAFASGEPNRVRQVCHKIKGGAGTIHAERIIVTATELGRQIAEHGLAGTEPLRLRLLAAIEETAVFVRDSGYLTP